MKAIKQILLCVAVVLTAAMASCSGSDTDVLSTIPADAEMVVRINLDKVLASAGFTKDGAKYVPGEGVNRLLAEATGADRARFDDFISALPALDAENAYFFTLKNDAYLTCPLRHRAAIVEALTENSGKPEEKDGLMYFNDGIIVSDNQIWMSMPLNDDKLTEILADAKKASARGNDVIVKAMTENEAALSVVINYKALSGLNPLFAASSMLMSDYLDSFLTYHISLEGNALNFTGSMIRTDGSAISMSEIASEIDDKFLKFVPSTAIAALAFGKPDEEALQHMLNGMPAYVSNIIEPYVKAIDGTVAAAVTPPADMHQLLNPTAWTFTLMAQYDESGAGELLRMAAGLGQQGLNVTTMDDQIMINVPGGIDGYSPANFYVGYLDGTLVASTQPISSKNSNEFAKEFAGYYSAGFLHVPAAGEIVRTLALPFGIDGYLHCEGEVFSGRCVLDGSDAPFVESFLLAATDRKMQRDVVEAIGRLQQ